jgi:hypothetical protein
MGGRRDRDIDLLRLRNLVFLFDSEFLQSNGEGACSEPSRCRGADRSTIGSTEPWRKIAGREVVSTRPMGQVGAVGIALGLSIVATISAMVMVFTILRR